MILTKDNYKTVPHDQVRKRLNKIMEWYFPENLNDNNIKRLNNMINDCKSGVISDFELYIIYCIMEERTKSLEDMIKDFGDREGLR